MMKNNILILVILGALIAVCIGYDRGWAQASREIRPAKVGVVNVELVFTKSRRGIKWQDQVTADLARIRVNLEKLRKDAAAAEADMRTREVGSADYMRLMSDYLDKMGEAEAKKSYYEEEMILKGERWTKDLYNDIRSIVEKTAKLRRLDIVLVANDIELSELRMRELAGVIAKNKVLYHTDEIDITEEVIAQLDSAL
jgi:Skp family chaperone for outer membrane proteins